MRYRPRILSLLGLNGTAGVCQINGQALGQSLAQGFGSSLVGSKPCAAQMRSTWAGLAIWPELAWCGSGGSVLDSSQETVCICKERSSSRGHNLRDDWGGGEAAVTALLVITDCKRDKPNGNG